MYDLASKELLYEEEDASAVAVRDASRTHSMSSQRAFHTTPPLTPPLTPRSLPSLQWNAEVEEMVCFSSAKDGGTLAIKTANFPLHKQKLAGFVVGFRGSKIYCLHYTAMQAPPCLPPPSPTSTTENWITQRGCWATCRTLNCTD